MEIVERKVKVGENFTVIKPKNIQDNIVGLVDNTENVMIFADSDGFTVLSKYFYMASATNENFVYHIPVDYKPNDDFKSMTEGFTVENNLSIVIVNYNSTQLRPSKVTEILKIKNYTEKLFSTDVNIHKDYNFNDWEIERKLTVKQHSKFLFIHGNKEIFLDLSQTCKDMAVIDEDIDIEECNFSRHAHKDGYENTYKSKGLTFHFWQKINR